MSKSIVERLNEGASLLGAWCVIPSSVTAEVVARSGNDFACIDMQHGLMDFQTAVAMLQSFDQTGIAPVVRVPKNDEALICQVLDAGAMSVIVPMVNTADEARAAVAAARYAPDGIRSFGPMRATMANGGPAYVLSANQDIAMLPMIETPQALKNVRDIAAVPGVTGLFVGPFDLSLGLGLVPGNNDGEPAFDEALEEILAACRQAGIAAGILANKDLAAKRIRQGFQFVVVSNDLTGLAGHLAGEIAHVRAELADASSTASNSDGY